MWIGLLIIRLVIGVLFIGHGCQKLFGWFGGGGPEGTGEMFAKVGLRPGTMTAVIGGCAEAIGGTLMLMGFLVPLVIGIATVMAGAIIAVHRPNGLWNSKGGFEFPLLIACVVIALAFTGAGRISIDSAGHLGLRGVVWGLVAVGLTILGACSILVWRSVVSRMHEQPSQPPARDRRNAA